MYRILYPLDPSSQSIGIASELNSSRRRSKMRLVRIRRRRATRQGDEIAHEDGETLLQTFGRLRAAGRPPRRVVLLVDERANGVAQLFLVRLVAPRPRVDDRLGAETRSPARAAATRAAAAAPGRILVVFRRRFSRPVLVFAADVALDVRRASVRATFAALRQSCLLVLDQFVPESSEAVFREDRLGRRWVRDVYFCLWSVFAYREIAFEPFRVETG